MVKMINAHSMYNIKDAHTNYLVSDNIHVIDCYLQSTLPGQNSEKVS